MSVAAFRSTNSKLSDCVCQAVSRFLFFSVSFVFVVSTGTILIAPFPFVKRFCVCCFVLRFVVVVCVSFDVLTIAQSTLYYYR